MFNFHRVIVGLILLIALMALVAPAKTYAANDTIGDAVILAAEEGEESDQGYYPLIIIMGLGAVAAVGGYYILRQRDASKNSNNE